MRISLLLYLVLFSATLFSTEVHKLEQQGNQYLNSGHLDQALNSYLRAIEICQEGGEDSILGNLYYHVGSLYFRLEDYPMALDNYLDGVGIHQRGKWESDLGAGYTLVGAAYRKLGQFDLAIEFNRRAVVLNKRINQPKLLANSLNNLGATFRNLSLLDSAISVYKEALSIKESLGDNVGMISTLVNLGNIFQEKELLDSALAKYKQAHTITTQIEEIRLSRLVYKNLVIVYKKQGDFKNACGAQENMGILNDSLFTQEKQKEILRLQEEFDSRERAIQIDILERERHLYLVYGGNAVAIIILLLLIYIQKVRVREAARKEMAYQLMDLVGGTFATAKRYLGNIRSGFSDPMDQEFFDEAKSAMQIGIDELREMTDRVISGKSGKKR